MATANKAKKNKNLRHAEYYDMTTVLDDLYAKSTTGDAFKNLMDIIVSEENIKLAYRNFKRNNGSHTSGVDKLTIENIANIPNQELVSKVRGKFAWYKPKSVRRVEIPKPNGGVRPLGIPSIWDRMVQQCILQVLDPICEAKFYERSNGFRPNRSAEHAIAQCMKLMQTQNLHFVVDIDIHGFFDNVNHSKLIKQMWSLGIQDKKLLCIIKQMLKAPIVMPDGSKVYPTKGTPQGGILSPLLSNIVLNELDWWVDSQWEGIPTRQEYPGFKHENGSESKAHKYRALRSTKLKEMYIVRYADDFKIFCRTRSDAVKTFEAVKQWLIDRLGLDISPEKSKVVNLRKNYSDFLGFKLKAVPKGKKYVVRSHMSDKAIKRETQKLKAQILEMQYPRNEREEFKAIMLYNSMVLGIHQYYGIATHISEDCDKIARPINITLKNRLRQRLKRKRPKQVVNVHGDIREHYFKSKQMRYVRVDAILPIGYIMHRSALHKKKSVNKYTEEGRTEIHKALKANMSILHYLMRNPVIGRSVEYADNRISLYSAQYGRCAVTGRELECDEIHCHHKTPLNQGGTDEYKNLIIVHVEMHRLIHATQQETIDEYMKRLKPNKTMLKKLNKLRRLVGNSEIDLV